jgi:hypothetical protein
MSEQLAYLDDRLESQRKWHSDKATWNKNRFYVAEIITLAAGALIPIINVFDVVPGAWTRVLSALLAAVIVTANGISKLYKFQENWLSFRSLAEVLKREKEFYLYHIGAYAVAGDDVRDRILVERVEDILAGTTAAYLAVHKGEREAPQVPGAPAFPARESTE